MLRRILNHGLIIFIIAGLGLACAFYIAFNTPIVSRKIIRSALTQEFPQYKIRKLKIKRQKFLFPKELIFSQIELKLRQKNDEFVIVIDELRVANLPALVHKQGALQIKLSGVQIQSENVVLNDIQGEMSVDLDASLSTFIGMASAQSAQFYSYDLQAVKVKFAGNQKQIEFKDCVAQTYGGALKGRASVEIFPELSYSAQVQLEQINLNELQMVSDVYNSIEGRLNGQVSLKSRGGKIESLALDLDIAQSGKIRSDFLGLLVQYVPTINMDKEKKKLFEGSSMIPFERGTIQLKNLNQDGLSGLIVLESRKLNMNFNVEPTINISGGLDRVIETWLKLSKKYQQ